MIFYHNDEQKRLALLSRDREAARRGVPAAIAILPLTGFYRAEDYHQKYFLRNHASLMREFQAMYRDDGQFVDSTAAARVNGCLGGFGSRRQLEKEIGGWGLSSEARQELWENCSAR